MRRFDLKDELRATADRRKCPTEVSVRAAELRGEGVAGIAARLALMFPSLPQDTVQAVLSQLFRADAACSREQLADRAVATLLDMCLGDGEAHALTSFEPRSVCGNGGHPPAARGVAAASSLGPLSEQALRGYTDGVGEGALHSPRSGCAPDASDESAVLDILLDEELSQLLALGDEDLGSCVRTLLGILDRIAAEPRNAKVRRLRLANPKFAAAVGRHPPAIALLRLAGFADDAGEGDADAGLACLEDPVSFAGFARVREALRGVAEVCSAPRGAGPSTSIRAVPSSAGDCQRRAYVADLTERRLRDPRGFRAEAEARGAANRAVGGYREKPAASSAAPQRRAQHFTLSDIDRLRVSDDIASMPNYAEEYRNRAHGAPVHDYGSLVARGYDPELIGRQALDATNRYRASKNLTPLRWHEGIARIAAKHAAQMASGAMPFSHDGFDARVRAFPVAHRMAAENLALNQGISDVAGAAVDGWIKSPGHERNLRGAFNVCGIGVARAGNGTFYLTQLFAAAL